MTGIFVVALASLSAILAGSLSMGEERTLGTHSSNRTLPVSATVQWLIKLTVILFVSCLGLIFPVAVAQAAFARDFISSFEPTLFLFAVPSLLSVAAFFCASAVKGTVRAALLVV
jgi:hypothetical protein